MVFVPAVAIVGVTPLLGEYSEGFVDLSGAVLFQVADGGAARTPRRGE
jgi:hypothetical protein